jgi:hypothetical protein
LGGAFEAQGPLYGRLTFVLGIVSHDWNLSSASELGLNKIKEISIWLEWEAIRMTAQPNVPLEVIVQSNAKLLKALVALLSLKDEHLLDELRNIFTIAARGGSEIGDADPAVWREINRRLEVIDALIDQDGEPAHNGDSGAH